MARGLKIWRIVLALLVLSLTGQPAPHCVAAAEDRPVLRVGVRSMNVVPSLFGRWFSKPSDWRANHRLVALLAPILGVKVKYVFSSSHVERRRQLLEGMIDCIVLDSPQLTSESAFDFVPLGLSINRQLYVNKSRQDIFYLEDLSDCRVAVISGDNYEPHLVNALGCVVQLMDEPHEALQALNAGEVDAFLAPSARTAENIIVLEELHDVVKAGRTIERIDSCITLRKDRQDLKRALEKAVARLSDTGQLKELHRDWYNVSYRPSPLKKAVQWGMVLVTLAVMATLLVGLMNRKLKSRVVKVTRDLRLSEEHNRGVIESAPDMVMVVDRQGIIQHSNPIADTTLGRSDQGVVGASLLDCVVPDEREAVLRFIAETFQDGRGHSEFKMIDRNHVVYEVDVAAKLLPALDGGDVRMCCFARDVTQRNIIERELVQADRLSTIGKMAAGMAHEINNPLGIVRANVELLLAKNLYHPQSKEFLEAIRRNAIRAGRITQDLLAVAKPRNLEMRAVDLEELVTMSLGTLGAHLKEIEIAQEPAAKPQVVLGDPNLLQQVLVNLFLNAKAAMNGFETRRLIIKFCPHSGDGSVRLRIEDTGRGIQRRYLNEIFEPFFTQGKREGLGLGLFISNRVIERHGGLIFAESELGKGTRFIIELPPLKAEATQSPDGEL